MCEQTRNPGKPRSDMQRMGIGNEMLKHVRMVLGRICGLHVKRKLLRPSHPGRALAGMDTPGDS